ncbi:hypothetical protein [Streptomyces sp. 4F14]|uniref:hypothetical protein n=1 Tax=Streptomyces sp. 4F14 TaxID=3394380 RepID=UPI003A861185
MERRGRTALLISTSACLGILAGVCTGYLVQAERTPTPLPPLSQGTVPQAKGDAPEPLSAARDRRVKVDGDLRKLLVTRPKGAKDWEGPWKGDPRWDSLSLYAETSSSPADVFDTATADGFRRAVRVGWVESEHRSVEVSLVQYDQSGTTAGAFEAAMSGQYWAGGKKTRSWPLAGTGDGSSGVYIHDSPARKAGYLPLYSAEAHAWRGDLYAAVYMFDTKPIPKAAIMGLAQRQMGKL